MYRSKIPCKHLFGKFLILFIAIIITSAVTMLPSNKVYASTKKTYTITTKTHPYKDHYKKSAYYNEKTKDYFTIRSYLEQLEKVGGGTLIIKKGTYTITNTLYIPSNVTIQLSNGVIIKKGTKTGNKKLKASSSIFQMAAPSKSQKKGAYGKYNGVKNVKIIGSGTVVFDLNYKKDSIALIMGHNSNIFIKGITFKNMYGGHFIELDASKNVTIEKCKFMNHKDSENNNKEAINLDTPDKTTKGFNNIWTNYDCTPNKNIIIKNNTFKNLERAIGTHKYSGGKYHDKVTISGNKITDCDQDPIRVMNWSSPKIYNNIIENVAKGKGTYRGILMSGVKNPTVTDNTFKNVARSIQIMPWKNSGPGSQYAITYNKLNQQNIEDMLKNTLVNVSENFIRVNHKYNIFDKDTDKYEFLSKYVSVK